MIKCPMCNKENPEGSKFCNDCAYSFTGGGKTGQLSTDTILEGRYIIIKTLGRGGMGAVYMALDSRLNNKPVAIKEMSTNAVGTGNLQAAIGSFKKEASILINLEHNALPRILDFFPKGEDRWYLVMDYIEGKTLQQVVEQRGPVPEAEVLDWTRQIGEILSYLHEQKPPIIFRDLKPSNIMMTPNGQIKLIDFGIARHFQHGNTTDTAAYGSQGFAPPEQYGTNQTDARADIYALGANMHYFLTGIDPTKKPFNFELPSKIVKVSKQTETVVMKALELKAENRPQNIQEMLRLLSGGNSIHTKSATNMRMEEPGHSLEPSGRFFDNATVPLNNFHEKVNEIGVAANNTAAPIKSNDSKDFSKGSTVPRNEYIKKEIEGSSDASYTNNKVKYLRISIIGLLFLIYYILGSEYTFQNYIIITNAVITPIVLLALNSKSDTPKKVINILIWGLGIGILGGVMVEFLTSSELVCSNLHHDYIIFGPIGIFTGIAQGIISKSKKIMGFNIAGGLLGGVLTGVGYEPITDYLLFETIRTPGFFYTCVILISTLFIGLSIYAVERLIKK